MNSTFGRVARGEQVQCEPAVTRQLRQQTPPTPPPVAPLVQTPVVPFKPLSATAHAAWLLIAVAVIVILMGMMNQSPLRLVIRSTPTPANMSWVMANIYRWCVSSAAWLRWLIVAGVFAWLHLVRTHFHTRLLSDGIARLMATCASSAVVAAMMSFIITHR